MIVEDN